MGGIIETVNGGIILSETSHIADYMFGNYVIADVRNELNAVISGNRFIIQSGLCTIDGKRIMVDSLEVNIPYTSNATLQYDVYMILRMDEPDNIQATYSQTGTYPEGYINNNLMNNSSNGIKYVPIWRVTASATTLTRNERLLGLYERDEGWVSLIPNLVTTNFAIYDGASVLEYKRIGNLVQIVGALKPAKTLESTGMLAGYQMITLPDAIANVRTSLTWLGQGSGSDVFLFELKRGFLWYCRLRSTNSTPGTFKNATTNMWIPINLMFYVEG